MRRRTISIAAPQQWHCSLGRSLNGGCVGGGLPGVPGCLRIGFERHAQQRQPLAVFAIGMRQAKVARAPKPLGQDVLQHQPQNRVVFLLVPLSRSQAFRARVTRMDAGLCPCCGVGCLRITAVLVGLGCLPGPGEALVPQNRGPPRRAGAASRIKRRWQGRLSPAGTALRLAATLARLDCPAHFVAADGQTEYCEIGRAKGSVRISVCEAVGMLAEV